AHGPSSGGATGAPASAGAAAQPYVTSPAPATRGATHTLQVPVEPSTTPAGPAQPIRVVVRRLGISSPLEKLQLLADGSLQSPTTFPVAGWFAAGIRPGAVGPAVIAGHVDSVDGPAVFYRLRDMVVGDDIAVTDARGTTRHFQVTDIHHYPKTHFPTDVVYGPTALPVLRLVTCTGEFDFAHRSYLDNLVVSAELVAPRAG
nr:class F sortase [Actinomycetota bacterium]